MTSLLNVNGTGSAHKMNSDTTSVSESFKIEEIIGIPCIVTSYKIVAADNIQFMPTLGEDLYAYILGTTPYVLTVSGLMYNDICEGSKSEGHCVKDVLEAYEKNKASKTEKPLIARIGETAFTVLLQDLVINASSENGFEVFSFTATLKGIKG